MKSILLSIKPEWLCKILNGEKTIEVRKKFPKDYVGWVYLYCSKGKDLIIEKYSKKAIFVNHLHDVYGEKDILNGKVVARFWCDNVEEITTEKWSPSKEQDLLKASCLTENQLFDYCNLESGKPFYAIHISKLEIFDKPKELSEFKRWKAADVDVIPDLSGCSIDGYEFAPHYDYVPLTKAPQNYCYIEGEE